MADPAGGCDQKGSEIHGNRISLLGCDANLKTAIAFRMRILFERFNFAIGICQ